MKRVEPSAIPSSTGRGSVPAGIAVLSLAASIICPGEAGRASTLADSPTDLPGAEAFVTTYCGSCHTERTKHVRCQRCHTEHGDVTFADLDLADVGAHAELWEKVVVQLRTGMMPPLDARRPAPEVADQFREWLTTELDRAAWEDPDPGPSPVFRRLNRNEYQNAVRDLLHVEIDAAHYLPADDSSHGFDNMAGTLRLSPLLMERYLASGQGRQPSGDRQRRVDRATAPTTSAQRRNGAFDPPIRPPVPRAARRSNTTFRGTANTSSPWRWNPSIGPGPGEPPRCSWTANSRSPSTASKWACSRYPSPIAKCGSRRSSEPESRSPPVPTTLPRGSTRRRSTWSTAYSSRRSTNAEKETSPAPAAPCRGCRR